LLAVMVAYNTKKTAPLFGTIVLAWHILLPMRDV